jgi:hypothetical protein
LALFLWIFYGLLVNGHDLKIYTLQHAGVEALVERGTYDLQGSQTPELQNPGDIIYYADRKLAAKQPGQFTLGAIPYSVLRILGFSYKQNYLLCSAIVSWFTTGIALALSAAVLLHLVGNVWGYSRSAALITSLAMGLGQTGVAYVSVPHHDVIATFFLVLAFWGIERARLGESNFSVLGGFGIGLSLWCSMLAAPTAVGLCIYAIFTLQKRSHFLAGVFAGLLPLFAYNFYYFGNPLISANIAGGVRDTFFGISWPRFFIQVQEYLGVGQVSLAKYSPIAFLGILAPVLCRQGLVSGLIGVPLLLLHGAYIFNIETIGHCQYGPRYLLPVIPFLLLGVTTLWDHSTTWARRFVRGVLLIGLTSSIFINLLGAIGGTIYCDLPNWAVPAYLLKVSNEPRIFPTAALAASIGVALLGSAAGLLLSRRVRLKSL